MKKTIRMNERELHRLISESVKRVLNETGADSNWQQGGYYKHLPLANDYEHNNSGVERMRNPNGTVNYKLRSLGANGEMPGSGQDYMDNGYQNWTSIRASKGGGINGLSFQQHGGGCTQPGQLESIIDELAETLGCSPDEIKQRLGCR